jgi:hypothetical protein
MRDSFSLLTLKYIHQSFFTSIEVDEPFWIPSFDFLSGFLHHVVIMVRLDRKEWPISNRLPVATIIYVSSTFSCNGSDKHLLILID